MRKLIVMLTLLASQARAAVPTTFSVEGVLRDGAGKLQSTMVNVSVALYDAQAAGNRLAGPYGPTPVMATNGLFSLPINDTAITSELGAAAQVWLEVSVGNDTFARQLVSSQIYALMCGTADALAGVLPISHGGTGSATQNFVDLTTNQSIDGTKTFNSSMFVNGAISAQAATGSGDAVYIGNDSKLVDINIANTLGLYGIEDSTQARLQLGSTGPTLSGAAYHLEVGGAGDVLGAPASSDLGTLIVRDGSAAADDRVALTLQKTFGDWNAPDRRIAMSFRGGESNMAQHEYGRVIGGRNSGDGGQGYLSFHAGINDNTHPDHMRILYNGNVGIGTSTPLYPLDVVGYIRASNVVAPSDATLKQNVRTLEHALDDVARLRGVRFDWKRDGAHSIGVIAQEVERVYPELVSTAPDALKAVDYMKLSAVLIEATKELHKKNAALEARLERLEAAQQRMARQ